MEISNKKSQQKLTSRRPKIKCAEIDHQDIILKRLRELEDTNSELRRKIKEQTLEINRNVWLYRILFLLVSIALSVVVRMSQKEVEKQYNRLESRLDAINTTIERNFKETENTFNSYRLDLDAINTTIERNYKETENTFNSYRLELEAMKVNALSESKYFDEMDKILHGIQWRHQWLDSNEEIYGPTFYLGLCRVRIFVNFKFSKDWNDHTANYYLKRYEGQYDDVIDSCRITYRHYTYVDEEYATNSIEWWSKSDTKLEVTKKFYIGSITKYKIAKLLKNNLLVFRVYFDTS